MYVEGPQQLGLKHRAQLLSSLGLPEYSSTGEMATIGYLEGTGSTVGRNLAEMALQMQGVEFLASHAAAVGEIRM
jgi:hypothetical protein